MTAASRTPDTLRLRAIIGRRLGLHFEDRQLGQLDETLARRLHARAESPDGYLHRLDVEPWPEELGALAQELTVGETYFFRHAEQFAAFSEVALPERLAARASGGPLRLLSAGCASGEEPYSIAMLTQEHPVAAAGGFVVVGVDINESALRRARAGDYTAWSLRETPGDLRARWFRTEGKVHRVDDAVRGKVSFERGNLADEAAAPWELETYDVIFCRNVLMYMTPLAARTAMGRMTRALAPGGYLFLGHAESVRGLSDAFELRNTHGTFYYQRSSGDAGGGPSGSSWLEAIRSSSARIETLSGEGRPAPPSEPPVDQASAPTHVHRAVDLLRDERFGDALQALGPEDPSGGEPREAVLRAALLNHTGSFDAAIRICDRLLAEAPDAEAHYVKALSLEASGDGDGAETHLRMAARIDPEFAMPRLRLGLAQHNASARRDLEGALRLLGAESGIRILLFAGGFTRDALVQLCRSKLQALGRAP